MFEFLRTHEFNQSNLRFLVKNKLLNNNHLKRFNTKRILTVSEGHTVEYRLTSKMVQPELARAVPFLTEVYILGMARAKQLVYALLPEFLLSLNFLL